MKKLYTLIAFLVIATINAQAPQGFNYQATVRNSSGELIINQNINFKFNIMLNSSTSVPVYSETHYVPTDDVGQVNLTIGTGTPTTGPFSSINWGSGTYYLGIELNTGAGYVAMGTTQLLSVPYALYANNAGSAASTISGLTHYIGELLGGGIVVSVWKTNGEEHGLIVSLTDLSTGIPWTTPAFQNTLIGPSAQSPRDGFANTNAIVAQAGLGTDYAAGLCRAYNAGGFTDWYLPATYELKVIGASQNLIFNSQLLDASNGFQPINNIDYYYWSSTEDSNNYPWAYNFGNGLTDNNAKGNTQPVRAVRRF
jgi:hypothetical protein